MGGTVFDRLFPTVPAVFPSDYPLAESIFRLREATVESSFDAMFRQAALGGVAERVWLTRSIPFVGTSNRPRFLGSFQQRARGVVLSGNFGTPPLNKVGTLLSLGFVLCVEIQVCIGALAGRTTVWWVPLPGLGFVALGVGSLKLGQWFARNDVAWLSDVITRALTAPDKLPPPAPRQPGWLERKFHGAAGQ